MLVQVDPSMDTWIWKALAYATSQVSTTWQMPTVLPRSTCTHCGSLNWLDQRVPVLPSTAAAAGVPAPSADDAVAGLFWDSSVGAARAGTVEATTAVPTTRIAATATATAARRPMRQRAASRGSARDAERSRSIGYSFGSVRPAPGVVPRAPGRTAVDGAFRGS